MSTTKTTSKGRWNPTITAIALSMYADAVKQLDGETELDAIARGASMENLKAIADECTAKDGTETYTPIAVRMKLVSEKVFQKVEVKAAVGGARSLRKVHIINAFKSNLAKNEEEAALMDSFEKANLDSLIFFAKTVCGDDVIQDIMKNAGVDKL